MNVIPPLVPKHQELGIVTWNVNHCSNHDITTTIDTVAEQLDTFAEGNFYIALGNFEELINKLEADPDIKKCMKDPEIYKEAIPKRLKEKLKGLQSPGHKLAALCGIIKKYWLIRHQIRIWSLQDSIADLREINWQQRYQEALASRHHRENFFQEIKELLVLEDTIDGIKYLLEQIIAIKPFRTLVLRFFPKDEQKNVKRYFESFKVAEFGIPNQDILTRLSRSMHTAGVVMHIQEMFKENNDWLDVVILQEVNNPALLEQKVAIGGYSMYKGPHMISTGGEGKQEEYFPLLVRANAGITVENDVYVIRSDVKVDEKDPQIIEPLIVKHGDEVKWSKVEGKGKSKGNASLYRPIVVYQVQKGDQPYWVGVVHTTPVADGSSGKTKVIPEFNRRKIYTQVRNGLVFLKQQAELRNIPLIVGGDYYLTAEAVVNNWNGKKLSQEQQEIQSTIQSQVQATQEWLDSLGDNASAKLREWFKMQKQAVKQEQIVRNELNLTVAKQIEGLGLRLAQPLSGTNPKRRPLTVEEWLYLQIADFFVYNNHFTGVVTGILRPQGQILTIDTEDLRYARYWQWFSDHFPVGAVFSLVRPLNELLKLPAVAKMAPQEAAIGAAISNRNRFAQLQLATSKTNMDRDLEHYPEEELEQLAISYLKGRMDKLVAHSGRDVELEVEVPSEQDWENLVQKASTWIEITNCLEEGLGIEPHQRLFVTLPEDFESGDVGQIDEEEDEDADENEENEGGEESEGEDDENEEDDGDEEESTGPTTTRTPSHVVRKRRLSASEHTHVNKRARQKK